MKITLYGMPLSNYYSMVKHAQLDEVPGLHDWYQMMSEQPITRQIIADMDAAAAQH